MSAAGKILITGASSGLGFAFLNHYASLPSPQGIIAIDATPFPKNQISLLDADRIRFLQLDIASEELPEQLIWAQLGPVPISLVIHCAGVRGLVNSVAESQRGDVPAAETWDVMDHATMLRTFEVNTWGSFNVVKSLLPNLRLAAQEDKLRKVVILSSRMGSVAANTAGGGYAYRASKAALNAVVKSFSIDVPEVAFLLLHPGRVETGLVEWKEEGAISVEESLRDCLKVIDGLKKEDSGRLVDRFGERIEW